MKVGRMKRQKERHKKTKEETKINLNLYQFLPPLLSRKLTKEELEMCHLQNELSVARRLRQKRDYYFVGFTSV